MSWWSITVYSFAALLAVRTLFALMLHHRREHLQRLMDEETQRQEAEAAAPPETAPAESSPRSEKKIAA
jgi:hypothetical protein